MQQQSDLLRILAHLRAGISAVSEAEAKAALAAPSLSSARESVVKLRKELYEQVVKGPMNAIEAHEFLAPHLNGASLDLLLSVVATLDEARRDGRGPGEAGGARRRK